MNECSIVQDLLPLYADDLVSEDSVEFIGRHTESCPKCREIWRRYKGELPITHPPVPKEQAEDYQKPMKQSVLKIALSALATWLALFVVFGYFVWEIGWLGAEKQIVSPDGHTTFTVKDYSNAGLFHKGGVYVLTPDGQGRDLKNQLDFVDLHIWWTSDSSAYFIWWEFTDHDESYYVSDRELQEAGGWKNYKEEKGIYGVNFLGDLKAMLRKEGVKAEAVEFFQWQDDSETMTFRYETETGSSGFVDYHCYSKKIVKLYE